MKLFLLILLLFAFLQSAFLPLNIVLVCLIARSLAVDDAGNYYLAFFAGLVLAFLSQDNIGYWPLLFLLIVKLGNVISKLPVSFNMLTVFVAGVFLIFLSALINMFAVKDVFEFLPNILESILIIPAFYLVKLWEERFVVKKSIRLKV